MELNLIVEWVLESIEKCEIDLAESGIEPHKLKDFSPETNLSLNYSEDKGNKNLIKKISQIYGVNEEKIMITNGSQEGIYIILNLLLKENDEIITLSSSWQQYKEVSKKLKSKVIEIPIGEDMIFPLDEIKNRITPKTKVIIINSPHNPTGVKLDLTFLESIPKGIFVINDEVYLKNPKDSIIKKRENSISIGSLSKIYGVPGIRLGWIFAPEEIIKKAVNYKRYTTISNSNLSEQIALEILSKKEVFLEKYERIRKEGLSILKNWITQFPKLHLVESNETPFAIIKYDYKIDSKTLCKELLEKEKVLLVPGSIFGLEKCFRISFGRNKEVLERGLSKISRFLTNLENEKNRE